MRAKGRSPTSAIAPPASIENHATGPSPSRISMKLLGCQQSQTGSRRRRRVASLSARRGGRRVYAPGPRAKVTARGAGAPFLLLSTGRSCGPPRCCARAFRYAACRAPRWRPRSEEHTSELQSHHDLVCRLLLEKKKKKKNKAKDKKKKKRKTKRKIKKKNK